MCGIAGALVPGDPESSRVRVSYMLAALAHRGPDGSGVAQAGATTVGMQRLRIRSTPDAILPFGLTAARASAAYNGEVYADSGVVPSGGAGEVAAILGSHRSAVDGMYALAVLDEDGSVRLLRDPLGIKPLFMRTESTGMSFASELPALISTGAPVEVEVDALHEILALGRTLDRRTIYRGVRELTPGASLVLAPDGALRETQPQPALEAATEPPEDSVLRTALREALARTLVADRPVGLALSGGLDSSILAYELRALGVRELRTVSLVLPDNGDGLHRLCDLGLGKDPVSAAWQHTIRQIDDGAYFTGLVDASRRMGEPFRMSSVPLYYALGEAARADDVFVLILGEGADEIFGGYESYAGFNARQKGSCEAICSFYLGGASGAYLAALIGERAVTDLAWRLRDATAPLAAGRSPRQAFLCIERLLSLEPLLRRADHALMAAGIEGRTPFLHGGLPALAAALPDADLWSGTATKVALRRAYRDVLPPPLAAARKRALRAPSRFWREGGVVALEALATGGRGLLDTLGLAEKGVAEIRNGCAAGDPAAIPLAVALISTGACLSRLAEGGRLADPELALAGRKATAVFGY